MNQTLFIKWNARNETGLALIDEQHRGIVSIINTFYYLMSLKTNNKLLYSTISDTMKNYSRIHFITEEGLLEAANYEDVEKHKALHRHLAQEIEDIEYQGVKANDARPLLEFLKKWWIEHINEQDMLYVPFLSGQARK
jgi:hemerythrin